MKNSIVCGVCGNRLHPDLFDKSLTTNEALVKAIESALSNPKNAKAILTTALAGIPKEVSDVWK